LAALQQVTRKIHWIPEDILGDVISKDSTNEGERISRFCFKSMKLGEFGLTILGLSKSGDFTLLWAGLGISLTSGDFSTVKN
jgi:hypothetical protein